MLATVNSGAVIGMESQLVRVEVDFNPRGMPQFIIVGLPDAAVQESRERVRSALQNRGLAFPLKRFTVNLSPADIRKKGPDYDLPIAMGVLVATEQLPPECLDGSLFIGELSLDGTLRHARGVLSMALMARREGFTRFYLPECDAEEAAVIDGIDVIPVQTLGHLIEHLYQLNVIPPYDRNALASKAEPLGRFTDFEEIKGQEYMKRAIEVAASGGHHALLAGPPGAGKTLIARALPGIMPGLSVEESIEITQVYSVADKLEGRSLIRTRPFRAPHHTISEAGLIGGGSVPGPGEISLAHRGVLFLDELPEYGRTLEVLRQPIEDKQVTISRAQGTLTFPANVMLVAAMNPCPCGYFGDSLKACTCKESQIRNYQQRISGPLLDRFDIQLDVTRVDFDKLTDQRRGEPSAAVRARVEAARAFQHERYKGIPHLITNSDLGPGQVEQFCKLAPDAEKLLIAAMKRMNLSARAYHRTLKLSRTIADLAASETIRTEHVAEAVQYRSRVLLG